MKKYESVFILDERQVEDQGKAFSEEMAELIKSLGGTVDEIIAMGRRQFARKIGKKKSGIYYDFVFAMEEDKVGSVKDKYRLDPRVLRMQTFMYDERAKTAAAVSKKLAAAEAEEQKY